MQNSTRLLTIAILILLSGCIQDKNTQNAPMEESTVSSVAENEINQDKVDQMPAWFFCAGDDCYEGSKPAEFKKINEERAPQQNYVVDPMDVSPGFKTAKKFVFATGINKPGTKQWVILERAFIGNDYILSIFDAETNTKTVLFDKENKIPQLAHTPKPISWKGDQLLIEDFSPDYAKKHHGVWILNPSDTSLKQLNLMEKYLTSPDLSEDGRYMLYSAVSSKDPDYLHGNANQLIMYDLELNKETVVVQNQSIQVFGWTKKKSELANIKSKKSVLPGFKLPWASGISRCTTRDGNVLPPAPIGSTITCANLGNHGYIAHDFDTSNFSNEVITAVTGGIVTLANFAPGSGGFSPSGYGNWVIVTHPNNFRTLYAHLSRIDVVVGQSVAQGCVLGLEGTTGSSTGDHLHFEYENPGGINGNIYTTFDECNCVPRAGYVYTSANTVGSCGASNLDCSNSIPITCGDTYFGSSSSASSNVTFYGCNGWTETGPERVHEVTATGSGTLTATLSNFSGDLDVYILGSCDPNDCLGTVSSSSATFTNAQIGQTYYIVVDADDGSGSGYNLLVSCPTTSLNCSNAVQLSCGVTYSGPSSSAASQVFGYGCNNWTETGPERVHTITPQGNGTLTATISNFTGDLDVYILGSCDPADCLGTVSGSSASFANAIAGTTYYIIVDADDGSGSSYNLIVDCPQPAGLDCSNAVTLTCGVNYFGLNSNAPSAVDDYGCNNWTETGPERVHKITSPGNGTLTATLSNFSGDLDVYILGSCDPDDCLGTVFSSSTTFTNAVAGATYYIVVDADDGSGSSYNLIIDCPDPPGLSCTNAVTLTCGVSYAGSSSSAVSAVDSYGCNNWTETGPERVHRITPQYSGTLTATISNFAGDLDVYILGSCDADDCLGTVFASSATFTNAIAGTTYYIVVDADDGSGSSYNLVVDCPEPPGLSCANAVNLTCGVSYAGPSSSAPSVIDSYGCNNWTETGPERVHTVTPQYSGTLTATISNFAGDLDVYILGSCDADDCLGTVSVSSATYTNATAGTTYYIVVDADDGSGSSYNLVVSCPPAPNNCPPTMSLTSPIVSGVYEAYIQISASAIQNNNTNVLLKGGNNVSLTGGFSVPAGAVFEASIEDCRN